MKRHGLLFDKIVTFDNLLSAAKRAFRGKRKNLTVAEFSFNLEPELFKLQEELIQETYVPRKYIIFKIYEPKIRTICCSNIRDRIVHHAICHHLEPIFGKRSIYDSYACMKNRGSHAAVSRCQSFVRSHDYFLKCDIKKYFESIDHEILKKFIRKIVKDKRLLKLLDVIIDHRVEANQPGKGIPIGNLTSQHFANFYLGELDHYIKDRLGVSGYLRYMDDFISFSNNKTSLRNLLGNIERFIEKELKLELKPSAIRLAPVSEGVPFLGFRIFKNLIRLQRPQLVRMRRKIINKEKLFKLGIITEGDLIHSVRSVIAHVSHVNMIHERRKQFSRQLGLAS